MIGDTNLPMPLRAKQRRQAKEPLKAPASSSRPNAICCAFFLPSYAYNYIFHLFATFYDNFHYNRHNN
jgi:hypothetical protein